MPTLPFNDIVAIPLSHMSETPDCRVLVESALYGCSVMNQVNWSGNAQAFKTLMVRRLIDFGECDAGTPAIVAVLEPLKGQVGANQQAEIDALIARINTDTPQHVKAIDLDTLPALPLEK